MSASKQQIQEWLDALGDFRQRREARTQLMTADECPVEPLMHMLDDASLPLNQRWAAMTILGGAKAEAAVPLLLSIMCSEHNLIGDAALALASITGLDHGAVPEEWAKALGLEIPEEATEEDEESAEAAVEETLAEITSDIDMEARPDRKPEPVALDQPGLTGLVKDALGARANSIQWDEEGYVHLELFVRDREQQVLVAPGSAVGADDSQVMIYTECGVVSDFSMEEISQKAPPAPLGKLKAEETDEGMCLNVQCWLPTESLDARHLGDAITRMAEYADLIEETFTGQDQV